MITVTRKIQLNFDVDDKSELKSLYEKIFKWQRIVHRAANWITNHQYIHDNVKDYFYFTDEVKKKLANIEKDENGILTTSKDNTTYQVLSRNFKGECPMGMLSGLNSVICKKYAKENLDVKNGKKTLASFRDNIPMPIRSADMSNFKKIEEGDDAGNFSFFVYGVSFKTYFGRDLSGNAIMFEKAVSGEYKLCDSAIQLEKRGGKWRIFLLASISFDKQDVKFIPNKVAVCRLSIDYPIVVLEKKDAFYNIGTAEEFLHRRIAIKGALSRLQKACRYNNGGKGREKKMQAIERFKKAENDYVDSRMHLYSKMLIDYCIKRSIGKIVLDNYKDVVEETHQDTEESKFLLASWSYFSLAEKIKYKAAKFGIEVELVKEEKPKKGKQKKEAEA